MNISIILFDDFVVDLELDAFLLDDIDIVLNISLLKFECFEELFTIKLDIHSSDPKELFISDLGIKEPSLTVFDAGLHGSEIMEEMMVFVHLVGEFLCVMILHLGNIMRKCSIGCIV